MKECWASCIGNCSEKITKEHTISKCILPEKVTVQGFSWCINPKEVFKESFKSYCLCDYHNRLSSELDIAAKDFLLILREVDRTLKVRTKLRNPYYVTIMVNGVKFERWCFKILCNVLHVGYKWKPPDDLVKMIYGVMPFPDKCGLSFIYNVGDSVKFDERFYLSEMKHPDLGVVGLYLMYYGWRLCGSWLHEVNELPGIFFEDKHPRTVYYHISNFEFSHEKLLFKIDWSNKFNNNSSKLIQHLRKSEFDK